MVSYVLLRDLLSLFIFCPADIFKNHWSRETLSVTDHLMILNSICSLFKFIKVRLSLQIKIVKSLIYMRTFPLQWLVDRCTK